MTTQQQQSVSTATPQSGDFDAVIVGAGFAGMYMLHRMRELGMTARIVEAGTDVGGTWYWNRYPGARCDVESIAYQYSFSEELLQEWNWSERYATQPEILALRAARREEVRPAPRHPVRDPRQLRTLGRGRDALDDRDRARRPLYRAVLHHGHRLPVGAAHARARRPRGLRGPLVPHRSVATRGRRLQRSAGRRDRHRLLRHPVDPADREPGRLCNRLPAHRQLQRAGGEPPAHRRGPREGEGRVPVDVRHDAERQGSIGNRGPKIPSALELDPEERLIRYQEHWDMGGPVFLSSFRDLLVNPESNDTAAEFVRSKIHEKVTDPEVAEILSPKDHPFGTKRICVDIEYFETYNRDSGLARRHPADADRAHHPLGRAARGRPRVRVRRAGLRNRVRRDDRCAAARRHPGCRGREARRRVGARAATRTSA